VSDDKKLTHNPFGSLQGKLGELPKGPEQPVPAKSEPKGPAKAVVRMERKGRGGKEVTVVEQLGLSAKQLDEWLKALKNGLGCGGSVEGDTLVLQGDQRKRVPALLEAKGVRKVVVG
jgi:translation initiation factor 1